MPKDVKNEVKNEKDDDKDEVKDKTMNQLSEDESKVAFSGPALAINRTYLSIGPAGVRLAFAEQDGNTLPVFRNAVIMPSQEAIALRDLLTRFLGPIEEKIKSTEQKDV